jgi:D-alanyl-D-alanine carboxypeptidase (penicillin-binding protein 5/6)
MMKILRVLVGVQAFLILAVSASFTVAQPALIPAPPQVGASSYVLMDATTGEIIIEENAYETLPPASLTKMMTAYIVESEIAQGDVSLTDEVPISVKAWRTGGSKMFIKEGTKVLLEDLLKGVIIQSGNDASIALAEYLAGSEEAFADIMNQQAVQLGMTGSSFMNATGLPSESHYSTAHDMALLARAIIQDYPEQYAVYKEKYFTYNNIRQPNRNRLLWRDKSVDGLKTGHTEEAGYCLVASAKREDMRLISVVMGTSSEEARVKETQKLLNYGFRYYETSSLYTAGEVLNEAKVWGGSVDQINLGLAEAVTVTIPRGHKSELVATLEIDPTIKAPVALGDKLGRLLVTLDGKTLVDQSVVALQDVDQGGFFKRIWDWIKLFFLGLFS